MKVHTLLIFYIFKNKVSWVSVLLGLFKVKHPKYSLFCNYTYGHAVLLFMFIRILVSVPYQPLQFKFRNSENPGILRDKTMDDILMYIPNDDTKFTLFKIKIIGQKVLSLLVLTN